MPTNSIWMCNSPNYVFSQKHKSPHVVKQGIKRSPNKSEIKIMQRKSPISPLALNGENKSSKPRQSPPPRLSPKRKTSNPDNTVSSQLKQSLSFDQSQDSVRDTYAGARFHNPPQPDVLPKPPTHWMSKPTSTDFLQPCSSPHLNVLSAHLKGLLKVQT